MNQRAISIFMIPSQVEECERNKNKLQSENEGTVQAYDRVIVEAQQLLRALQQQRVVLNIDNSDSINHIESLIHSIGANLFKFLY